jgi:hypothetical protein
MVPDTGRVLIRHFHPHVIAIIASSTSETIRLASFPTHIGKTIPGASLADPVVDFSPSCQISIQFPLSR